MYQTPELSTLLGYRFAIICISREIDLGSSTIMSPEPASSLFCMPDSAMGPRVCRGSALIRQLGNKTSFFWARHGQSETSTGAHATQDRAAWSALAPEASKLRSSLPVARPRRPLRRRRHGGCFSIVHCTYTQAPKPQLALCG